MEFIITPALNSCSLNVVLYSTYSVFCLNRGIAVTGTKMYCLPSDFIITWCFQHREYLDYSMSRNITDALHTTMKYMKFVKIFLVFIYGGL